jgi:hypothetical protein|tara:strand:- start:123 stop:329 length:207 start_codon:yes stop_codon:yes gene_type:complete
MLLLVALFCTSALGGLFFYCQAVITGFGRKRWTLAGILFGPFIWPMFSMKKRMRSNQLFGFQELIFRA